MKRRELLILVLVLGIAAGMRLVALDQAPPGMLPQEATIGNAAMVFNETGSMPDGIGRDVPFVHLQASAISLFGASPEALRVFPAILGLLTVLGTYLLARRLFDQWQIAAISAFLMAVGFWPVHMSRIAIGAPVLAAFAAVWGFYFFYKGVETHRLWYWGLAGAFFGLGMIVAAPFGAMPLALAVILLTYAWALHATFSHEQYRYERHRLWGGIALMLGTLLLVYLPLMHLTSGTPSDLSGVFTLGGMLRALGTFFVGLETDPRQGIVGTSLLFWPVAALFAVGLGHTLWRIGRTTRTHGHPGTVHVMLVVWFLAGLVPAAAGSPELHSAAVAAPAVFILTGLGLHWLIVAMRRWYALRGEHRICVPGTHGHRWCGNEGMLIVTLATLALLTAFGIADSCRYFTRWAVSDATVAAFSESSVIAADRIRAMSRMIPVAVISRSQAPVVQFLTDTATPAKAKARNVVYLTPEELRRTRLSRATVIIELGE